MPKFQSATGYPVHIFPSHGTHVIEIGADTPYETDDPAEIQALKDSPEVTKLKPEAEPAKGSKKAKRA